MRKILALLLVSVAVCSCGKKVDNNLTEMNLKGKVKSLHETSYMAEERFGKIEKAGASNGENMRTAFNPKGNVAEVTTYDEFGNTTGRLIYRYDDKDRQTEGISYLASGTVVSKNVFEYDGKDLKSVALYTASDSLVNNNVITSENGKPAKYEIYGGDGQLMIIREFKYSNGYVIEESIQDVLRGATSKVIYTRKGDVVLSRQESQGDMSVKFEYEYDKNNNPVKMILTDEGGDRNVLFVEYKYDEKGNWTQQTLFRSETRIPVEISERTFEYYE